MTIIAEPPAGIQSLELEITGRCQLTCSHCLASSGPSGTHGTMTADDWRSVIDQAAKLRILAVQFIGGEPTLHPDLPHLVRYALDLGLTVEVYSNLAHIRPAMWEVLSLPGVRLGTSYYSDRPEEHEQITGGRGSHARTKANIIEAVRRGIPIRAGIVHVLYGQRIEQAQTELRALSVEQITVDRARAVGRAAAGADPTPAELCGHCARQRAAVLADGQVVGCVLSRFMPAGNIRTTPLAEIIGGARWEELTTRIPAPASHVCPPLDGGDCNPASTPACPPKYSVIAATPGRPS